MRRPAWLERWSDRRRDERGSATVFVIGFAIILFVCAGLVVDGGLAINKRMRIADDAEQAARIGADSIDVNTFRATETLVIDRGLAESRMSAYLGSLGYGPGQWSAGFPDGKVTVDLEDTSKTYILSIFKITFNPRAFAEAVPDTGQAVAP